MEKCTWGQDETALGVEQQQIQICFTTFRINCHPRLSMAQFTTISLTSLQNKLPHYSHKHEYAIISTMWVLICGVCLAKLSMHSVTLGS